MTEPQTERTENAEVLQIKAQHQMARMEHEQAMALFDERSIGRMPLALRLMFDDRLRERVQRAAEEMSRAVGFTPQHLIGKTEACLVVVTRAITWNLDPYSVAMSTYQTPGGKVGYEGALVRAILEASGELRGTIKHKYYGEWQRLPRPSFVMKRSEKGTMYPAPAWDYWSAIEVGLGVTISATLADTGEEMSLDFDLVDAHPRNATTWPTRPKLQLLNPAIRTFARQVRPSLLMGVHLRDDFSDAPEMRDVTPEPAPAQPQRSMDRIVALNTPPPRETIPQTAPGRPVPPQDAGYSEPPRPSDAATASAAAAREAMQGREPAPAGEPARRPRRSSEQITLDMIHRIMEAQTGDEIEDELALSEYGRRSLPEKERIEEAAAERRRELEHPQERPPEPAGEARSQEPAATPAPGRAETEGTDTAAGPASNALYVLVDTRGDMVGTSGRPADAFLSGLHHRIDNSRPGSGEAGAWKMRNKRELQRLAETEGGDLGNDALDLLA